jgi:hypothetical protein
MCACPLLGILILFVVGYGFKRNEPKEITQNNTTSNVYWSSCSNVTKSSKKITMYNDKGNKFEVFV